LSAPSQYRFASFLQLSESVFKNQLQTALFETAEMFLAMATRRMERIADRQSDLGAVHIKHDAAQLFDGPRECDRRV
jgi:hypothetical protein